MIAPSRGLRQCDPLFSYLFILVVEGLSAMIKIHKEVGNIHGVVITKGAPMITHICFASDCYMFCRANTLECRVLKEVLEKSVTTSGQVINYNKSSLSFSKNVGVESKNYVSEIMEIRVGEVSWVTIINRENEEKDLVVKVFGEFVVGMKSSYQEPVERSS